MSMITRACLLAAMTLHVGAAGGATVVWQFDAATGAWLQPGPGAVQGGAGEAITSLDLSDTTRLLVGTRDLRGELAVWQASSESPAPELLSALPAGPTIVLCSLLTDQALWVGTDAGLYARANGEWTSRTTVNFRRPRLALAIWGLPFEQVTDHPLGRVVALWEPAPGEISVVAVYPDPESGGGVFTVSGRGPGLSRRAFREVVRGPLTTGVLTRDSEHQVYQVAPNLVVQRIHQEAYLHPFGAARVRTETGERYEWKRIREGAPNALFFDREERVWLALAHPTGNMLLRWEPEYWVIDDAATELLRDQGQLVATRDADDVVFIGTGKGMLFRFDGITWGRSKLTDEIARWFPEGDLPPLRPVWTADEKLWVAAGNLLFCLDCPAG
jgi:ligand-binding sensor domain-containing protein